MNTATLQTALAGLTIPAVRFFESTSSTNDVAMEWAASGAADGALVVANQQTSGRGRSGRRWVTRAGAALAFSLVVRPTLAENAVLGRFSPLGGLAVANALEALGLTCEIKWPNDVLARRQKLCGILAEAVWDGETLQGLVLGVGVNVAPTSVPPADEVIFPATSVEDVLGRPVERLALLRGILAELLAWRAQLASPAFLEAWQSRLAFRGDPVWVTPPTGAALHGILAGVDPAGNLRLLSADGQEQIVAAGDVRLRPSGATTGQPTTVE
jgi:BirA family biotin operon repressor/biotin-[acetyl-CoA-carboxylase] ligase